MIDCLGFGTVKTSIFGGLVGVEEAWGESQWVSVKCTVRA